MSNGNASVTQRHNNFNQLSFHYTTSLLSALKINLTMYLNYATDNQTGGCLGAIQPCKLLCLGNLVYWHMHITLTVQKHCKVQQIQVIYYTS